MLVYDQGILESFSRIRPGYIRNVQDYSYSSSVWLQGILEIIMIGLTSSSIPNKRRNAYSTVGKTLAKELRELRGFLAPL